MENTSANPTPETNASPSPSMNGGGSSGSKQDREQRKAEQAKADRARARKEKLAPVLRLLGIVGLVIAVIIGLILFAESQEGAAQPSPLNNEVTAIDHVKGNPEGQITIIEYADFQCPACAAYAPVVRQLVAEYPEQIRYVFRHFPLKTIHPNATLAGQAAEAAHNQGKFWEMHDMLFDRQAEWSNLSNPRDTFVGYAEELGLNAEQFRTDLDSKEVKDRVDADYRSGTAIRITGTPSFFMDGQPLQNPRGYEAFKAVIDAKLQQ